MGIFSAFTQSCHLCHYFYHKFPFYSETIITPLFNSRRLSAYIAFQLSRVLREVRAQVSMTNRAFHCIPICQTYRFRTRYFSLVRKKDEVVAYRFKCCCFYSRAVLRLKRGYLIVNVQKWYNYHFRKVYLKKICFTKMTVRYRLPVNRKYFRGALLRRWTTLFRIRESIREVWVLNSYRYLRRLHIWFFR